MDPVILGIVMIIALVITIPIVVVIARQHKCKYDEVQDDGYQYCSICKTARKPIIPLCSHPQWENVVTRDIKEGRKSDYSLPKSMRNSRMVITAQVYVLRCKQCGDLKEFRIEV